MTKCYLCMEKLVTYLVHFTNKTGTDLLSRHDPCQKVYIEMYIQWILILVISYCSFYFNILFVSLFK